MSKDKVYQNIHKDIINNCRKGDSQAQFQLYKLYYKAMYNVSLRILGDPMEAEDTVQESFLKAFRKIDTYSGSVSFGAWLKRIVINGSLDALKKRKVEFEPIENIGEEPENLDEKVELEITRHKAEEVKRAIEKLPEGYKVVINLYAIEGYDHDEISQILNISGSTSRSQYIRAKKKLLQILNEGK